VCAAALNIRQTERGLLLPVKVVPGASRSAIVGVLDGALKVAVSVPPEKGKANKALILLLAEALDLPRQDISVEHGHGAPRKTILLQSADADDVRRRIDALTGD